MNELLPILGGLLIGLALHRVPSRLRAVTVVVAAIAVGGLATLATGEYLLSWGFLIFDIPLAGISTAASHLALSRLAGQTRQGQDRAHPGDNPAR